ncbi:MAG: hypothetical protein HY286_14735 [Planctomycetes bacterium]|nr:hypothetical protein [Planctomycetota bacterium]
MPHSRFRLEQLEIPESIPGFTLRCYQPGDETRILESFNRVFSVGNAWFEPRTIARWNWQFIKNPAGTQIMLAVHDETGEVAAQFAAVPRKFRAPDRSGMLGESVDSFVDARFRTALRRPGLFVVTVKRWCREFIGAQGDFFLYGLPIEAAARIGGAFLNYQCVENSLALEKNIEEKRPFGGPSMPAVSEVYDFDGRFDEFWRSIESELGMSNIRDAQYLRWRYLQHPEYQYRIGVVGDAARLDGYAITRFGAFDDRVDQLVVDFLARRGDADTMRSLLRWTADRGLEAGAKRISLLIPSSSPWFLQLQRMGFFVRSTKYEWNCSQNRKPFETHALRKEWHYTLGDTDLA